MTERADRILTLAGALALLVYFAWFAGPGLLIGFMPDDLMNAARARSVPLAVLLRDALLWFLPTPVYRPFGGLLYWLSVECFGLTVFPMRLLVYTLLLASLWLLWRLARRAGVSREAALLACLLWSYHSGFYTIYFSNGAIYDVLCSFLALLVLEVYTARPDLPSLRLGLLGLLYALALGAKEAAVCIPALLVAWEWVVRRRMLFPPYAVVLLTLMTVPWLYTHLWLPSALPSMEAYRVELTWPRFAGNFRTYTSILFDRHFAFEPGYAWAILFTLAALGLRFRRNCILFGLAFFWLAYLPLAFIGARSLYAIHLSVAGLSLAIGSALELISRLLFFNRADQPRRCALYCATLYALTVFHSRPNLFNLEWMRTEQRMIRDFWAALDRARFSLPAGANVLLLDDPLQRWEWASAFATQLYYRDPRLLVVNEGMLPTLEGGAPAWNHVWQWRAGALLPVKSLPEVSPEE